MRTAAALAAIITSLLAYGLSASPSLAAGFSILESFPANNQTNVPVNLINSTFKPLWNGYAVQTIGFKLDLNGHAGCRPDTASFNKNTVQLTSPTDPAEYAVSTISSGLGAAPSWIGLGSAVSGFELLPYTNYTLFLSHDVKLHCDSTTLPLATDYAIHFTTGKDTVAPQILGPQVSVTSTTAAFSWETFQAANHRVRYGQSSLTSTAGDDSMGKYHRVQLANLQPGITYSYQLTSTDPSGNTGRTATSTFTTLKVNNVKVSDITDMAATITWQTNQPTDTLVEFGPDDQYGYRQGNGGQVTNHSLRLVDLNPDQTYHFRIVATNNAGTSTFDDAIFATLPATTVAGSRAANREDVSMSTDNIKLFPQVSFAQPLVLGASTAADTIYTGVTLGKNLLVRTGLPAQTWPSWLVTLIWLIPLLLLVAIGLVVWRLRQQKLENRK